MYNSYKADCASQYSEEEQSPDGVGSKALMPYKKMLEACERFLERTEIMVDREQPKDFQGMDVVEPLLFRKACYVFADTVLDMDMERADYRGVSKVPPFLPITDDVLGKLLWPLAHYSFENPVFMPYKERCNYHSG